MKTPIIIFGSQFFLNSITWITQKILGVYLCMVFEICFFFLKNKGNKENIKTTFGPSFFFFFCSEKYGEHKIYLIQIIRTIFRNYQNSVLCVFKNCSQ